MNRRDAESLRDQAAQPVLVRIRSDLARAEPRLKRMLEYIAEHLFDPQLQYSRMCSLLGIKDHNRAIVFRRQIGSTPAAYIRDCRFEVAAELLRRSDLEAQEIAELLGWSSLQVFTTSFRGWSGVAPLWFRKQSRGRALPEGKKLLPRDELPTGPGLWRRLAADSLTSEESTAILRHLVETYPQAREWLLGQLSGTPKGAASMPAAKGEIALKRDELEVLMARAAWEDLAELALDAQMERVRAYTVFRTPALVGYLGERSLEVGRQDADRGVHVARLALAAAVQLEGFGDEEGVAPHTALASLRLGNALRIAGDVAGAEHAFSAAERRLPASVGAAPAEHAELWRLRAALRFEENRFEEALELSERAVNLLREQGNPERLAKALIVLGQVRCELKRFGEAVGAFRETAVALEGAPSDYLTWVASFELALCRFEEGDVRQAELDLQAARNMAVSLPSSATDCPLAWLEARIATKQARFAEAAASLQFVIGRFQERGKHGHHAVALLDLALIRLQERRPSEAFRLVEEAVSTLEASSLSAESALARRVLARGAGAAELQEARAGVIALLCQRDLPSARGLLR